MNKTNLFDEKDKIWLACFIDSEGSIYLSRRYTKTGRVEYQAFIQIYNNFKPMIDRSANLMNTENIRERKRSLKENKNRKQTYYTWISRREHIQEILEILMPYFMSKRKQAETLNEWIKSRKVRGKYNYKDDIYFQKLKILNKKGII